MARSPSRIRRGRQDGRYRGGGSSSSSSGGGGRGTLKLHQQLAVARVREEVDAARRGDDKGGAVDAVAFDAAQVQQVPARARGIAGDVHERCDGRAGTHGAHDGVGHAAARWIEDRDNATARADAGNDSVDDFLDGCCMKLGVGDAVGLGVALGVYHRRREDLDANDAVHLAGQAQPDCAGAAA